MALLAQLDSPQTLLVGGLSLGFLIISLGIHESQSRMWETLVGRSRGFWRSLPG